MKFLRHSVLFLILAIVLLAFAACGEATADKNGNAYKYDKNKNNGFTFDKNGNVLSEVHYRNSRLYLQKDYTYDEDGNMLTMDCLDEDEGMDYRVEYIYDKNGTKTGERYYNKKSNPYHLYLEYTYDQDGNVINEVHYNADGSINRKLSKDNTEISTTASASQTTAGSTVATQ